jgi:hypothetical protein
VLFGHGRVKRKSKGQDNIFEAQMLLFNSAKIFLQSIYKLQASPNSYQRK